MKDFSIYERARLLFKSPETEDLGRISSISRQAFDDCETVLFSSGKEGVEYACLMIENALLLRTSRKGRVYAGVQKLSFLRPVIDRYLRIADLSESVFIFGESDWEPPRHPNIRLISLKPDFKLASESFLIADSPTVQIAVMSKNDEGRIYGGREQKMLQTIKTSNPEAVNSLANAAEGMIDWSIVAL